MGYYHEDLKYKRALFVYNSVPAATPDVEFVVPYDWDEFWNNVDNAGDDIRVTLADGETLCNFSLSGWSYANRTVTIQIDAATMEATAGVYVLWLYWGDSTAAAATTSTTITSALNAYVDQGVPSAEAFQFQRIGPGATSSRNSFTKGTNEEVDIWFDFTEQLRPRATSYNGRLSYEEPFYAVVGVTDAGSSEATMFEQGSTRFVFHQGRYFVAMRVKAGNNGEQFTCNCRLKTVLPYKDGSAMGDGRVLESSVRLFVQNAVEAT